MNRLTVKTQKQKFDRKLTQMPNLFQNVLYCVFSMCIFKVMNLFIFFWIKWMLLQLLQL